MKWHHSACEQPWFLSEWQAREDAAELAAEVAMFSPCDNNKSEHYQFPLRSQRRGRHRLRFSPELELAMCTSDDFLLTTTLTLVEDFEKWPTKPWSLRPTCFSKQDRPQAPLSSQAVLSRGLPTQRWKTTDSWHNVPSTWSTGGQEGHATEEENDLFLHDAPASTQRLFDAFLHGGFLEGQRLSDSYYVRSWYLHHQHHPQCHHPRVLEFSGHWRFWMHDLIDGWRDMHQADDALEVYVVNPDPPRPTGDRDDFCFDIILVQGQALPLWAGLITVLDARQENEVHFALAASLPQFVSGILLAEQAQQLQVCHLQGCALWHGTHHIPLSHAPVHEMTNGDSFIIVPHHDNDAMQIDSEHADVDERHGEDIDPPDEEGEHEEDESPSMSAPSPVTDPQAVHIYRLGYPPAFGFVDWNTYYLILRDAAQTVGQPVTNYVGFHYPQVRLQGHQRGEEAIILQHVQDVPLGSYEKLAIVDLELHSNQLRNGIPAPPSITRNVHKLPHQIARRHLLISAKIDFYCTWMEDQCIVILNDVLWHPREQGLRQIDHGAYVRILVPPPRNPDWDFGLAIRVVQDTGDLFDFPEAGHLAEQILDAQCDVNRQDYASHQGNQAGARLVQCKGTDITDDLDIPMMFAPSAPMPTLRPPHDGSFDWLLQLGEIFANHADVEVIGGDPLLYVQTWFIHHERFPKCSHPRPVRLDGASVGWIEEFRYVWRDLLDRSIPFGIHVVHPRPPQLRTQSYSCHLILEQAPRLGRAAGVLSQLFEGRDRDVLQHFAATFPASVNKQTVIETLQLQPHCDGRRCTVTYGDHIIHLILPTVLPTGFSLSTRLHLPDAQRTSIAAHEDPIEALEHFGDLALFQQELALLHQSLSDIDVDARDAIDLEGGVNECATFSYALSHTNPAWFGNLNEMSSFVQDLHAVWIAESFSWEMEPPSASFTTWFADHQRDFPHCTTPRNIVLFGDFNVWEDALKRLWHDQLQPGADLSMTLVTPVPPQPDAAGHIILIQRPDPLRITTLVTWTDESIPARFGRLLRMAITSSSMLLLEDLIEVIGYTHACLTEQGALHCRGWCFDEPLRIGRPRPGQTGLSLVLQIQRRRAPPEAATSLLQIHTLHRPAVVGDERLTHGPVAHTRGPHQTMSEQLCEPVEHPNTAPASQSIDFTQVIRFFEEFDSHFFLPRYDLPGLGDWHPAFPWTQLWWEGSIGGEELWIYYDGSFKRSAPSENQVGIATAAFVRSQGLWYFAGALSFDLAFLHSSYQAELHSAIAAAKLTYDLLKIFQFHGSALPVVHHVFDSTTVGNQASGKWQCHAAPLCGNFLRNIHLLLEARFGCTPQSWHVKGHSGDPGNELVDTLAGEAAIGCPLLDTTFWFQRIAETSFSASAMWFWALFAPDFAPFWHGHELRLPLPSPSTTGVIPSLTRPVVSEPAVQQATIQLKILSCNVLSLKSTGAAQETEIGLTGPARQTALLAQLHAEEVGIFAFQETRLRKLHSATDQNYILYKSAATAQGQCGLMIGLSKTLPYATIPAPQGRTRRAFFWDDHVSFVYGDPRVLILRLDAPFLRCLLLAGHAPHSGQTCEAVEQWWLQLSKHIPQYLREWPIMLFVDANTLVGADEDGHIGSYQAGRYEERADFFAAFLHRHGIFLPSTFEQCQAGTGETWTHSGGRKRRIDFIGLPIEWHLQRCSTWVAEEFDAAVLKTDHSAVCAQFQFQGVQRPLVRKARTSTLKLDQIDVPALLSSVSPIWDFQTDVHAHAAHLQYQLETALMRAQPPKQSQPRKTTMSASTWALVQEKRHCRSLLAQAQQEQNRAVLEQCFSAWKHRSARCIGLFADLRKQQDQLVAGLLWRFRQLGRQVSAALHHDDRCFFRHLLEEGADFLHPGEVKKFWAITRRSLPRFRSRKMGIAPHKLVLLEDQWVPYLEELEVGKEVDPCDLVESCCQQQQAALADVPPLVSLDELPTLQAFEDTLRQTQAGKATGCDQLPSDLFHSHATQMAKLYYQLLLKIHLWGAEPAQFKGGKMVLIPKKLDASQPKNFRGILLLPSIAKRLHALVRVKVIQVFQPQREISQLGGLPGQQVLYGSQGVRAATNLLAKCGFSTAVLFVDLANAFHRLVREFVTGSANASDTQAVIQALTASNCELDVELLAEHLPPILHKLGCSHLLQRLLRDIHSHTWLTVTGNEWVQTRRGTRPGSPLADAIFHLLMGDVVADIRQWILEDEAFTQLLAQAGIEVPIIVWSDDLALVWATAQAADLPEQVVRLMQEVDRQFQRRGFSINYDKGKTSAVVAFQGSGAVALRRSLLFGAKPSAEITFGQERVEWLHFVPAYKHLGTSFSSSRSLEHEVRARIGAAKGAFNQLSRAVVCNWRYPRDVRLRLFHALVGSRLFFGVGAWSTPTIHLMRRLKVVYVGMLRKVLRLQADADEWIPTCRVLVEARTGDIRARIAMDRLAYAQKFFRSAPSFLQQIIFQEHRFCPESWLHGLFADLAWLQNLVPDSLPPGCTQDLTPLLDLWQQPHFPWKRILRRAWTLYLDQEEMMWQIMKSHSRVIQTLKTFGAEFQPDPLSELDSGPMETSHPCHCGRTFSTPQGLALHKWKVHNQHAPEHGMIDGAVCPACLKSLWSSNRLRLHLSYMPRDGGVNPCFDFLQRTGFTIEPAAVHIPAHLRGTMRLDALPGYGPYAARPHHLAAELALVQRQIDRCEQDLVIGIQPDDPLAEGERLGSALTRCTRMWAAAFCLHRDRERLPDLEDWWIELISSYGQELDPWTEMIFLLWGEHEFPTIIDEQMDGEVEYMLDEHYAGLVSRLPRPEVQSRLTFLQQKCRRLLAEQADEPKPHRPVRRGSANISERQATRQTVPHLFEEQVAWQDRLRAVRWGVLPRDQGVPFLRDPDGTRRIVVAHLFSGRRRWGDVHYHLQEWSKRAGIRVTVLSLDTAVSCHYGNLDHRSETWAFLCRCYQRGVIAATILGTPCETFSEARFQAAPEGEKWPRPLRSASRPFGLRDLTRKELKQAGAGSRFFLQGLEVFAHHATQGGYFLSEHPAPPQDELRPTIWRVPLTLILRQHPEARLSIIQQWEWHAPAVKPTGLLGLRLPYLVPSMRAVGGLATDKPHVQTVGKGPDGTFKTACLKEYPVKLSEGFARAVTDQFQRDARLGFLRECTALRDDPELESWIQHTAQACFLFLYLILLPLGLLQELGAGTMLAEQLIAFALLGIENVAALLEEISWRQMPFLALPIDQICAITARDSQALRNDWDRLSFGGSSQGLPWYAFKPDAAVLSQKVVAAEEVEMQYT
eukprot:s1660_g3.t1